MVRFYTSLLLLLILASCAPDTDPALAPSGIVGAWRWTGTYGGITGNLAVTPASTGANIFLELRDDSRYEIFRNDTSAQTGTYALSLKRSIYDHEDHTFITFSPADDEGESGVGPIYGAGNGIIGVNASGELTIDDNNYDGVGSVFVRR
ncbi:hypothetical protein [Lewinella sp. IMCC34183]|uniref:hypothetical protein n=1 Tax=Lewinella sp. IMCC34183 TaxID=2248762 RepID=UPI000E25550E|nr:hypothetical protein [Lewinella sp. IMCC34183]